MKKRAAHRLDSLGYYVVFVLAAMEKKTNMPIALKYDLIKTDSANMDV